MLGPSRRHTSTQKHRNIYSLRRENRENSEIAQKEFLDYIA